MRSAIGDVLDDSRQGDDAAADADLLRAVLDDAAIDDDTLAAFNDMLEQVTQRKRPLTERQREWVRTIADREGIVYPRTTNLVSRGVVPRGREVEPLPRHRCRRCRARRASGGVRREARVLGVHARRQERGVVSVQSGEDCTTQKSAASRGSAT